MFLFYVLFEAMLVPMYFLIGVVRRRAALVRRGEVPALQPARRPAHAGRGHRPLRRVRRRLDRRSCSRTCSAPTSAPSTERLLFLGFFVAFAIKAPLWPVHTWLPDAAAEAPPGGAVLLVGVLDKVGTFGMIRFCLPLFPDASQVGRRRSSSRSAVIGILYGALLAIGQTDMKRLIAYTSISHFGFIVLGIFAMTTQGQSGSTLYMVNHGFSTAALFLIAGFLISRRGSRLIADYGGVQRVAPLLAGTFLVAGLSSLALPGLSSFVSEFLVLVGTFTALRGGRGRRDRRHHPGRALHPVDVPAHDDRRAQRAHRKASRDLNVREAWVVGAALAVIIALGFYPEAAARRHQPRGRRAPCTRSASPTPSRVAPAAAPSRREPAK